MDNQISNNPDKTSARISWIKFAFAEGAAKATNKSLHKYLAGFIKPIFGSYTVAGAFFISSISSSMQMLGGLVITPVLSSSMFCEIGFANPKSRIFTTSWSVIITFAGLMSR